VTAPLASPERANWRDLIPYREGIYVLDVELYADHMVRLERANALPAIIIRDLTSAKSTPIAFDEAPIRWTRWSVTSSRPPICGSPIRR